MASVSFYVGAYYLYFFLRRPQMREHLPFAFLCLSLGFYDVFAAGLYNSLSIVDGVFWQGLQLDTVVVISLFMIWFTGVLTRQEGNRILRFSIVWFVVIFLVSLFASPELTLSPSNPALKNINLFDFPTITYYEGEAGLVYQVALASNLVVYLYLFYLYVGHYRRTKQRTTLLILTAQILYFFGTTHDSLVALQFYQFIYIGEYIFFFIVLVIAYALLNKVVDLHIEFEAMNVNLEHKVHERTTELKELNGQLKFLAERDGLTGVYNRRFFNEYFEIEVQRAMNSLKHKAQLVPSQDSDMNFGLAMIDIDRFKHINDTYGHLVGDNVMKQVIEIIERNIFSRDVLCRYGGDEFALLLTKTANSGILQAAEKIRREIDEHVFDFDPEYECQHVTISVGLIIFDEVINKESEEILRIADNRLLRAKSNGRNRIIYNDDA